MSAIVFGDGVEPWSVVRGGIKRWLHCRVEVADLADEQYVELGNWLAVHNIEAVPSVLLMTRDGDGVHRVHVGGAQFDVALADLPAWLQRPEPEQAPTPKKATKAVKAVR